MSPGYAGTVVQDTGISKGYLRPIEGIVELGEGEGKSRGAINWDGVHFRKDIGQDLLNLE